MPITNPNLNISPSFAGSAVNGIYQEDLIVKTMFEKGLQDLRNNPKELDLVFSSFVKDEYTRSLYGEKERQQAIKWFLESQVSVLWDLTLAPDKMPSISYSIQASDEMEFTLADKHYQTDEDMQAAWEPSGVPSLRSGIESSNFKNVVRVGCHIKGDPVRLTYLYSVCLYVLLKYRKTLLESRGFERSTVGSGPYMRDGRFEVENVFTRFINLIGYVRNSWASDQTEKISSVSTMLSAGLPNRDATGFVTEEGVVDPLWLASDVTGAS